MTKETTFPKTVDPDQLADLTFDQLPESLQAGATRAGWTTLMPVQSKALSPLLAGRDMMVQARTGSGKTGAFLLPMLERLQPDQAHCQALVLVPTRELAKQVWQQAEIICDGTGLRAVAVYGGVGYGPQIDALKNGAQLVIGTPGRVLDHLLRGTFSLDKLQMRVFDEADRMLSMGFYPDMQEVQRHLPARTLDTLHNSMFSATFPSFVLRTAQEFLRAPEFLSVSGDQVHVTDTAHVFYLVPAMDKDRSLVRIIEIENPASAIIFCNTKAAVHYVTVVLQRFGYDADELSADRSQTDRERILKRVRAGTLRFLVATDVAARGLDIPELSHVIQYETPEDPEGYIHRAGRTGRAGAAGVAIALVSEVEAMTLDAIAKRYGIDLQQWTAPTDADVEAVVTERVTTLLEARLRERDSLKTERSQRFVPLARRLAENEDESALIAMLVDDYYQEALHAPMMKPPEPTAPPPSQGRSGQTPHLQQWTAPTDADVEAVVTERVTTLLEARLRERDSLKTERSQRFVPLARRLAENEDESALIAMLVDDYYQEALHAPMMKPPKPAAPPPSQGRSGPTPRPRMRKRPPSRKTSRGRR